ncbi:hypothetical protein CAC42_7105 [Sphaceloma murrayae]|uniref:mRNA-capping enzyme subunit alpha n=1 Tax=Sphaceloma murrayae TaxID=2082308 RepID=A0A2K1QQV2_9PEZI|nr:hypothetical protein CAC42_7105 [Sphaceloma murrayae]
MSGLLQLSDVARFVPQDDDLTIIKDRLADTLGSRKRGFPGAQPVSFSRKHLHALKETDYFICEKTDGIRCLMYITFFLDEAGQRRESIFLIDRKNDFYYIDNESFHFPLPNGPLESFHTETLADGELVLDTYPDGHTIRRYMVFDCLALDGQSIMHRTLDKRLGIFRSNVLRPQEELFRKFPDEKQQQPFEVIMKQMEKGYGIEMMLKDVLPKLTHGNDGLVFTCRTTPYQAGTDPNILKWKPPHENTIDFRLQLGPFPKLGTANGYVNGNGSAVADDDDVDWDGCPKLLLLVNEGRDKQRHFGDLFVTDDEWTSMKSMNEMLDGRIIECYKDNEGRWRYKREKDGTPRFRDDKTEANHISTVESVLESIEDAVSEQDLLRHAPEIRHAWKRREGESERRAAAAQRPA